MSPRIYLDLHLALPDTEIKKQISAWTGSIILKKTMIEKIVFPIILMLKYSYISNDFFLKKSPSKSNLPLLRLLVSSFASLGRQCEGFEP